MSLKLFSSLNVRCSMSISKLYPLDEYPIDLLPFDMSKKITLYSKPTTFLALIDINKALKLGKLVYEKIVHERLSQNTEDDVLNSLYFTVDTGYIINEFIPNDTLIEMIRNHPDIAITNLDKALLGCIYIAKLCVSYKLVNSPELDPYEFLYGFIYFFNNIQKYELKNRRTIDLNNKKLKTIAFEIMLNPNCKIPVWRQLKLSEKEVLAISEALEYRNKLIATLTETRKEEKEYAQEEENKSYWELFLSCINFRKTEEQRVLGLVFQDMDVNEKNREFTKYFDGLKKIDSSLTNSSISIQELAQKINERCKRACNYLLVNNESGELIQIDNTVISVLCLPISFDCVLIAYHAYLLKQTRKTLRRLVNCLYIFITRNISQIDKLPDSLQDEEYIEDNIVDLYNLIFDFYNSHKALIDNNGLQFDSILSEETLSGFSFEDDINAQIVKCQRKMFVENYRSIDDLKQDEMDDYFAQVIDALTGTDVEANTILSRLPNKISDVKKLKEQEICKRLVLSINAIYILSETISRMIENGIANEARKEQLISIKGELSGLEYFLVNKTYVTPTTFYIDYQNMNQYRVSKGIDVTFIEKRNEHAFQRFCFENTQSAIKELHEDPENITLEKANEIKETFRNKINSFPDCDLKEFVIELVDEESLYLNESLIKNNSGKDKFVQYKETICDYIGSASNILPEKTKNTLATAELLFSEYAVQDYASAGFDYSCISALYYQAVESTYNELLWAKYANMLNELQSEDGIQFTKMYFDNRIQNLPEQFCGYLPTDGKSKSIIRDKDWSIKCELTIGGMQKMLSYVISGEDSQLKGFSNFINETFNYTDIPSTSLIYREFKRKIRIFCGQLEIAIDRRNAASHGQTPIKLGECKKDKLLVLSNIEGIRNGSLGLIMMFLSLYR